MNFAFYGKPDLFGVFLLILARSWGGIDFFGVFDV